MDDENQPQDVAPRRPFTTIPARPPVREVRQEPTMEEDIRAKTVEAHQRSIMLRTEARRDALTVVTRARERAGSLPTLWNGLEADTIHAITDLLLQVQGQSPGPMDPAFARRDETLARAARMSTRIEEATRGEPA